MAPSSELGLAIDCCRAAFGRGGSPVSMPNVIGWPLFLRVVRFHRVQGLAWSALSNRCDQLPDEIAETLATEAAAIAAANLRATVESRGLLEDFDRAGIPLLFLKGLTLGALAYGNASLKAAIDIDLLVAENQVNEAARVLDQRGLKLIYPAAATPRQLRAWHAQRKESVWARPGEPTHIDLHTRLSDNRALLPAIDAHSPRQSVEIADGISLPTLQAEELFAYLCVHGASSAWFRLKWIADFAAFLHRRGGEALDHLYRRSQELRAGRAAGQALLLADRLFGSLEPNPGLREKLNRDAANRWLCNAAYRQIAAKAEPQEPTRRRFGTAAIHLTQLGLLPGLSFKLRELARQIRIGL